MPHRFVYGKALSASMALAVVSGVGNWWFAPGVLLVMLLVLQFTELVSCYGVEKKSKRHGYDWNRAIFSKFYTWSLWVCAIAMDGIVHLAPTVFHSIDFPFITNREFLPFTITSTAMFCLAELARIAHNAALYQGKGSDAWLVMKFLQFFKLVNQQRWQESGRGGDAPDRWSDSITPEQAEHIAEYLQGKTHTLPMPVVEAAHGHPPAREALPDIPRKSGTA